MKQCTFCLSYIGRGKPHKCNKKTRNVNQTEMVKQNSYGSKSKVAGAVLKDVCDDQNVSRRSGTVLLKTGGRPLPVTVGLKTLMKPPRFTADSLLKLQEICLVKTS